MSILIKGMTMPKAGNWKTIRVYYNGTCAEPNWQGDCKIMKGCEAVPVPDHGDLIDESETVEAQYYDDEHEEWSIKTKTVGDVLAEICEAPPKVVIPAEREEASICDNCDERSNVGCSWCRRMERSEDD